jgi:arginyl-tRNA synthetase
LLYKDILEVCERLNINFDHKVDESSLQEKLPEALSELKRRSLLVEKEGATWFKMNNQSTEDKEAVVIKSDGSYTYFASDIVYHLEKFKSRYDLIIDVFGSNTAGHVPKLQSLAKAFEFDLEKFKVILYQFVRVKKGNDVVKMSKRAGNFVTAEEVLDEVGKDAFRFLMLMSSPNTHMDFDLELAKKQSNENPVYYVQYAHARTSNILAKAETDFEDFEPSFLETEEEKLLTRKILEFPDLVSEISENLQVHHLTHYAVSLADLFHKFYEGNRVLSEDKSLTKARLALVAATQIVLKNNLSLLGVSAPERM